MRYLIIGILLLASCNKTETDIPYHQLDGNDMALLPTHYEETGTTSLFRNQVNEETALEVTRYHFSKETSGGIGTGIPINYFDQLDIELKVLHSECGFKRILINKTKSGSLIFWFDLSEKNDPCYTFERIRFDSPFTVSEMTIEDFVYDKVLTINSGDPIFFGTEYEIKTIYFDLKYGFIGFDDVNDIQFRRVSL